MAVEAMGCANGKAAVGVGPIGGRRLLRAGPTVLLPGAVHRRPNGLAPCPYAPGSRQPPTRPTLNLRTTRAKERGGGGGSGSGRLGSGEGLAADGGG